jgi:hypothetical protein
MRKNCGIDWQKVSCEITCHEPGKTKVPTKVMHASLVCKPAEVPVLGPKSPHNCSKAVFRHCRSERATASCLSFLCSLVLRDWLTAGRGRAAHIIAIVLLITRTVFSFEKFGAGSRLCFLLRFLRGYPSYESP